MEPFEILYVMFSQMILNLKDIYSVAVTPNLLGAPLPELHGHSTPKYSRAPGVQRPSSETGPLGLDPRNWWKLKVVNQNDEGMVRKKIKLPGLRKKSLLHLMNQAGHFPFGPGSHGIYVPGKEQDSGCGGGLIQTKKGVSVAYTPGVFVFSVKICSPHVFLWATVPVLEPHFFHHE